MMMFIRVLLVIASVCGALTFSRVHGQSLQKVTINYPTRSGATWPLYIARDGGYYQKHGLEVDLQFGVHPTGVAMLTSGQAVMVNHSLEQGMVASARDLITGDVRRGVLDLRFRIDAEDEAGHIVYSLPFKQALTIIPEGNVGHAG